MTAVSFYYSPGSRTLKAFNEAVSAELIPSIEMVPAFKNTKPSRGHLVLVSGEGVPSRQVEAFAARIGAFCVCVPEASDWLTAEVRRRIENNMPLVMVDAALATTRQLSGAR